MKDKKVKEVKENISNLFELPKEIIMDLPKISLIGDMQISIENHKGIIEYTTEKIRINTKDGILIVIGEDLFLKSILTETIVIRGEIRSIEFDIRGV